MAVCVPVEKYCDREADCPSGSDESYCSCDDWKMIDCNIGIDLCIYKEWLIERNGTCRDMTETNIEYWQRVFVDSKDTCVAVSPQGVNKPHCSNSSVPETM